MAQSAEMVDDPGAHALIDIPRNHKQRRFVDRVSKEETHRCQPGTRIWQTDQQGQRTQRGNRAPRENALEIVLT